MKKLLSTLLIVFFATSLMANEPGSSCENPIPVDSTYRARVEGPCEIWYSAGTYDLPLNVHFVPDNPESTWGPEVEVDFTCTYGVYDDPKIDSLINIVSGFNVEFPLELLCDKAGTDEQVEWDLSVNDTYRDQLAEFGVTYNVKAFVRVRFYEAGLIRLQPDTVFASCLETAEHVALDEAIPVLPNDSDRVFVMPYTDWQNDSIQFVWTGDAPATIWLATGSCDFLPSTTSGYVCAHYNVEPGIPYRVSNQKIIDLIKANTGGGIFYAKVLSSAEGTLLTEKIPLSAIQGDATLLEYDQPVQLSANAVESLYCFPKKWGATLFTANTKKAVTMYVGHSADFSASADDANVVGVASFGLEGGSRALYLSSTELANYLAGSTEDYLYVRFVSEVPMTITPYAWAASECADQSTLIAPNVEYMLQSRSGNTIFRIRYTDFEGYPFAVQWRGSGGLPVYISDTCTYVLSSSNEHVLKYLNVSRGRNITIDEATLSSWESHTEDGYLYVRFNPSNRGMVSFLTDKPEEEVQPTPDPVYTTISESLCFGEAYEWNGQTYNATDEYTQTFVAANGADSIVTLHLTVFPETPDTTEEVTIDFATTYEWHGTVYSESGEYSITLQDENGCDYQATLLLTVLPEPLSPCVAASIELLANDQITLNLNEAVTIYRINYEAWVEKGVELVWSGTTALHTFVAEGCEFLLSETNKHVLRYEHLLSDGAVVIDAAFLSSVAHKVDEDGFLYIRFLSVEEGTLTTIQPE